MTPPDLGNVGGPDAPHVSEVDAPATDMTPPDETGPDLDEPHVSEVEAPPTDMTPPDMGYTGTDAGASEAEAPTTDMNAGNKA